MSDTIETYQAAVRRLTAENRKLRESLDVITRLHDQRMRVAAAELRTGLTPELLELRHQLKHWRERAQVAEQQLKAQRRMADSGPR